MTDFRDSLGQFEQLVLTAIHELGDDAFGLQVYKKICELSGKIQNLGSMYVTLDRLERKGFITTKQQSGTPERGGKPKRFSHLTKEGRQALLESLQMAQRLTESFFKASRSEKWGRVT
jgi:PadR family transcriptional regulator PadR